VPTKPRLAILQKQLSIYEKTSSMRIECGLTASLLLVVAAPFSLHCRHAEAFSNFGITYVHDGTCSTRSITRNRPGVFLHMQRQMTVPEDHSQRTNRHSSDLKSTSVSEFTVTVDAPSEIPSQRILEQFSVGTIAMSSDFLQSFLLPVISASLMVTGNTVGASMLVLPEIMEGKGYFSFGVLIVAWFMNLISGLTVASVAIQQKEKSGEEVPSSFKEFAEATLPSASTAVSGISIAINILILSFDVFKAGQIGGIFLPMFGDEQLLSYLWGLSLALLVSTQSLSTLSKVASLLVMGMFGAFATLLLPGLANVADVGSVVMAAPTVPTDQLMEGLLQMAPVVITTLVFQNIVPTVTRLLAYNRSKVTCALTIGSVIPLLMYMAWSVAFLGGGIDPSSSLTLTGLISCFGLITVAGSSLGTSMSLSEEFETMLGKQNDDSTNQKKNTFSFASVASPIVIALLVGQLCSSNINDLLQISGSLGSPLLYGAIPVAMALMQQQGSQENSWYEGKNESLATKSVVPGGNMGLGTLGLGSIVLVGTELVERIGHGATVV
jgi:tyrosine-specific transport protein